MTNMQNVQSWTDQIGMISGLETILTRKIPVPTPVLSPWLAEGESALIHAAAGVGKTLMAQSLALAASTGGTVLNTQGSGVPVLYIDGEMGEDGFQARAKLLCDGMEVEIHDAAGFDLIQSSACPPEGVGAFPYLDKEENREQLKRLVVAHKIKLVVIDNLRCLARIEQENEASSFTDFNQFLAELAALKTAVLVVHHDNKSNGYSGSTAAETPLSIRIHLTQKAPSKLKNACFDVTVRKDRRGVDCEFTRGFSAELDRETGKWYMIAGDTEAQLLDFMKRAESGEFTTQSEAGEAFGVSSRQIRRWVGTLKLMHNWVDDTWTDCTAKAKALREIGTMTDAELSRNHGDNDPVPFDAEGGEIY